MAAVTSRNLTALAAVVFAASALTGCQSFREATGAAKAPPDEFTVLTKAPLVIPPDYNLRPPQPGAAARNEEDPEQEARDALFGDPQAALAALGTNYSDGEKLLLTKSGALTVDPNIRRSVSSDIGIEDKGAGFTDKVLSQPQGATVAPASAP